MAKSDEAKSSILFGLWIRHHKGTFHRTNHSLEKASELFIGEISGNPADKHLPAARVDVSFTISDEPLDHRRLAVQSLAVEVVRSAPEDGFAGSKVDEGDEGEAAMSARRTLIKADVTSLDVATRVGRLDTSSLVSRSVVVPAKVVEEFAQ